MTDATQSSSATSSSPQPVEDLERMLDKAPRVVLTRLGSGDNFRAVALSLVEAEAIRATLARERELRETLRELVEEAPTTEEVSNPAFERAIERAEALLAQPAVEEREGG